MRRVKALLVGVEEEHTAIVWEHETLSQRFAGNSAAILSSLIVVDPSTVVANSLLPANNSLLIADPFPTHNPLPSTPSHTNLDG